jgi:uncharacterized membrane protein YqjE
MATDPLMEPAATNGKQLVATSQRFAQRLFTSAENRLELLIVEIQEERQHLLRFLLLALSAAVFGILAGVALSLLIVVSLWELSPAAALLALTSFYSATAVFLYRRLTALRRDWRPLAATLDQLRKDRACLEKDLV